MAVSNSIFAGTIIGGADQYLVSNGTGIGYAQQAISQRDYERMQFEQMRHMEEQRRFEVEQQRRWSNAALRNPWEEPKKEEPQEKPQTDPLGFLKKADTKLLLTQEN